MSEPVPGSALDVGPLGKVATFSRGIARIPHLASMIGAESITWRPRRASGIDAVVGWGRKPNTERPRRWAARHGVPFVQLEDGFLRSVDLGVSGTPPLSVVVDPIGIHYDATRPSAIERALAEDDVDEPALMRARACLEAIREAGLSKYNAAPDVDLGPRVRPRILVVDQTAGDLSVTLGGCLPGGFEAMVEAALDEHADAEILVKIHPDVLHEGSGKGGHLLHLARDPRVRLITEAAQPMSLLKQVDHVYVMSSLMGVEALFAGCDVSTFGVPFYAGWGLTDDRAPIPERRGRARTLTELFAIAYLRYPRYLDPERGEVGHAEDVIEHLALQRRAGAPTAGRRFVCAGFSIWKRAFLPSFLRGPGTEIRFVSSDREADRALGSDCTLVMWASRESAVLRGLAEARGADVWRMEDGFLRSVGLGSDLFAPASLVLDDRGVYYDPRTESQLEHILQTVEFDADELARAARLRALIVEQRVSKYNVGTARPLAERANGRPVVLAIGQVEDDASIQKGCVDVRTNEDLVREARKTRPRAHLIYKPHPDVVSGNRSDGLPLHVARRLCDEVIVDAPLPDCLDVATEVHTMTSLVGFEGLLRELPVVVYGQPFYAGWGLTVDRHPHPRRTRRLTLDELVAGVLLRYARYVHPVSGAYTSPERIVRHLAIAPKPSAFERTWAGRQLRKGKNLAREVLRAPR